MSPSEDVQLPAQTADRLVHVRSRGGRGAPEGSADLAVAATVQLTLDERRPLAPGQPTNRQPYRRECGNAGVHCGRRRSSAHEFWREGHLGAATTHTAVVEKEVGRDTVESGAMVRTGSQPGEPPKRP